MNTLAAFTAAEWGFIIVTLGAALVSIITSLKTKAVATETHRVVNSRMEVVRSDFTATITEMKTDFAATVAELKVGFAETLKEAVKTAHDEGVKQAEDTMKSQAL